jgi:hypothetical protein
MSEGGCVVEVYMNECSQLQAPQGVKLKKNHSRYDGAVLKPVLPIPRPLPATRKRALGGEGPKS